MCHICLLDETPDYYKYDLDFLKSLDDDLSLELCGIVLPKGYDISLLNEFRRFAYCDISEMIVGDVQSPFIISCEIRSWGVGKWQQAKTVREFFAQDSWIFVHRIFIMIISTLY